MKNLHIALIATILIFALKAPVQANLTDRGSGLIYDDDLNITWLQDANLSGATMSWHAATSWADTLVFHGFDDWRLPVSDTSCTSNSCTEVRWGISFTTKR